MASGPAPSFSAPAPQQLQTGEPTAEGLKRQVSADDIMRASGTRAAAPRPAPEPIVPEEDVLIEPGTGSTPRKGSAQRRAASSSVMVELDPQAEPGSAQQSFIAAARRARETAVGDAQTRARRAVRATTRWRKRARAPRRPPPLWPPIATSPEEKGPGALGRARAFISQRKRPILLSLAGIVLALGALTVVRSMNEQAPQGRQQVGALQPPSREPAKIQMQAQAVDKAARPNVGTIVAGHRQRIGGAGRQARSGQARSGAGCRKQTRVAAAAGPRQYGRGAGRFDHCSRRPRQPRPSICAPPPMRAMRPRNTNWPRASSKAAP